MDILTFLELDFRVDLDILVMIEWMNEWIYIFESTFDKITIL